jgi:hypothetical protein
MKLLNDSSIIVCSIVRNAENGLKKNIPVINALCDEAKDYKIVVYENDSKDNTKLILKNWSVDRGPEKVHILLNDNIISNKTIPLSKEVSCNPFFSSKRIEKMVYLRNQYISYIKKMNWEADYVIIVDLDVEALFLENILSSFSLNIDWDAITAYGYSLSPSWKKRYHDTYALVEFGNGEESQTEQKIKDLASKYGKLKYDDSPIRVFSAFGGLAIYRYEAIKDVNYQLIFNNDDRVEVYCEHYSIYYQMNKMGYDRIFINPGMYLKYQAVTLNIILNTMKRHLVNIVRFFRR